VRIEHRTSVTRKEHIIGDAKSSVIGHCACHQGRPQAFPAVIGIHIQTANPACISHPNTAAAPDELFAIMNAVNPVDGVFIANIPA
jgi:hypothetical protein